MAFPYARVPKAAHTVPIETRRLLVWMSHADSEWELRLNASTVRIAEGTVRGWATTYGLGFDETAVLGLRTGGKDTGKA